MPVEIIQRNSDGVLVKAELAEGDQVVTQGAQRELAAADAAEHGAPPVPAE